MTAVNSWCWPILSVLSYTNRKVPCVRPSGGLRQFIGTTCGSHFYLFLLNKSSQHVVGMIITCPLMSLILNHIQSSMTSLESNSHRIRLSWDFSFYSHTSASMLRIGELELFLSKSSDLSWDYLKKLFVAIAIFTNLETSPIRYIVFFKIFWSVINGCCQFYGHRGRYELGEFLYLPPLKNLAIIPDDVDGKIVLPYLNHDTHKKRYLDTWNSVS